MRYGAQLLLDALERTARIRRGRGIEQDRKQAGEPADRARQVDALEQVLAAVAFQRDQQRPTAGPVGERLDEGGQQHVIDLRVVDCRHLLQQRQRVVGVEPGRHGAGGAHQIHTVRMVDGHAEALRGLRAIYIDSGSRDQFFLDLGAEGFRRALERIGVTDVSFELFDGTHGAIEYRYPIALRYLAERL